MSTFIENLSPKEWEDFCAIMLRHHYTQKNFWEVPDEDQGDLGLEFYTIDGTLFQCYCPDLNTDMPTYKRKIQSKIRNDLKKLEINEKEIKALLDEIVIDQWILLIPKMRSKDLIAYCNRKKKEILKKNLSFIDVDKFQLKIETAGSFPQGKLFAERISCKIIDIPLIEVSEKEKAVWQEQYSEFLSNIIRKSESLVGETTEEFQDQVVIKYIRIEKFLDQLREEHPDIHELVEDSARAQLESMQEESLLEEDINKEFVRNIVKRNIEGFSKYSEYMSDQNMQALSFGYLSKWLAECYMDFKNE